MQTKHDWNVNVASPHSKICSRAETLKAHSAQFIQWKRSFEQHSLTHHFWSSFRLRFWSVNLVLDATCARNSGNNGFTMNYKPGEQVKGKHKQREPRKTNRKLTQRHTVCTYYKLTELKDAGAEGATTQGGADYHRGGTRAKCKAGQKIYKEGVR